jgi:hypothetical protein
VSTDEDLITLNFMSYHVGNSTRHLTPPALESMECGLPITYENWGLQLEFDRTEYPVPTDDPAACA